MGSNMMGMQGPAHNNSCSSPHVPSMHSEAKLVSQSHTHTHTHTLAYFPSFLPCIIWFEFIFIFCYCYSTSHPCKIYNTCTYKHKEDFSLSLFLSLKYICAHTQRNTLASFSFYYNACQLVWCISRCPEHTLVPLLLVSTSSAWRWSHQKQSSQSELSETERKTKRKKQTSGETSLTNWFIAL